MQVLHVLFPNISSLFHRIIPGLKTLFSLKVKTLKWTYKELQFCMLNGVCVCVCVCVCSRPIPVCVRVTKFCVAKGAPGRSQWPRHLRCGSAAARLLGMGVWIPPAAWMSVPYERCVLSGRGLCDELITRPEESYQVSCVCAWSGKTPIMRRPWPTRGGGWKDGGPEPVTRHRVVAWNGGEIAAEQWGS